MPEPQSKTPWGLRWRSSRRFIVATVGLGLFTDLFLYGLIVPVLPYLLSDRVGVPQDQVQTVSSGLLAAYAGASVLFSPIAGILTDRLAHSRQLPFLLGLLALLLATILLLVGHDVAILAVARILQGISAAVVWTIGLALILDTVGPQRLGTTIGSIFGFISIGELAAPVLGGLVYSRAGLPGVFGMAFGVLALDFAMRLLLIEKKVALRFSPAAHDWQTTEASTTDDNVHEQTPLLPSERNPFQINISSSRVFRAFPLLYCLQNPRLPTAFLLALVHATLLATFDATIPTLGQEYFGFSSLQAGLIFIALILPYVIGGPLAGMLVDRKGPRPAAILGFGYLVMPLILLRLAQPGGTKQIVVYCVLLALNGVGLAVIGSPSIVEASTVVQAYDEANPDLFGSNGPYAQLYGLNSMVFSLGLTLGPIISGMLKERIGYGNMNLVVCTCLLDHVLTLGRNVVPTNRDLIISIHRMMKLMNALNDLQLETKAARLKTRITQIPICEINQ